MASNIPFLGEMAALGTAACWTVSATSFEAAGKRIGAQAVNIIRLAMAVVLLGLFNLVFRGQAFPSDASPRQWLWLSLSGLIGFTMGDLFLFEAFTRIGSRVSMLIMAFAPALTAALGFIFLKETMSAQAILGMALTMVGIALVVLKPDKGRLGLSHPVKGILLAFGGALGQAAGLILSKIGMQGADGVGYSASSSAQIRAMAGTCGFIVLYFFLGAWPKVFSAFRDKKGIGFAGMGAVAGPFIGVSLSLLAVINTDAGVASSLMSITPVLIIPISVFILKEKIRLAEILGAALAVAGVACMFLV
jgi:drug/metabolite transporter (DMT)-like permease